MLLITDHLAGRRRRDGSHPLITYYDLSSAERTELSAVSFGNWVDKTANFIDDELGLGAGDVLAAPLLSVHRAHWVSLVWAMAAWQAGVTLSPDASARADGSADAWVVGPAGVGRTERPLVACSLHPLGLGFSTALADGVVDYGIEVRSQPDANLLAPPDPAGLAWSAAGQSLTQQDLVAGVSPEPARRLVRVDPADPDELALLRRVLIGPLLGGGSAVVVTGTDDPARVRRIAADEHAEI